MKPNTRLLVRVDRFDGSQQGYGYDSWHSRHMKLIGLLSSVEDDFKTIPEHVSMHIFYNDVEKELGHVETWEELKKEITELMGDF